MDEKATCRGCGRELYGKPYYTGQPAFIKDTRKYGLIQAPVCHYGGHVCSEHCDRKACAELEGSMPGYGGKLPTRLSGNLDREISQKWDSLRREYPGAID